MKSFKHRRTISRTFLFWLLIIVTIGFLVSLLFSWTLQTKMSQKNAFNLLSLNIQDVKQDIMDASDKNLLDLTWLINAELTDGLETDSETLKELMKKYDVSEINVIDKDGIILASTYDDFVGFDMKSGEQSAAFMPLATASPIEMVQSYQPIAYDNTIYRKYAGASLRGGGFIQVAYDANRFHKDINEQAADATKNRHVGQNGCIIIADENLVIVSDRRGNVGRKLSVTGIDTDLTAIPEGEAFEAKVYTLPSYCMYGKTEGYYIIAVIPKNEIVMQRDTSVIMTGILEVIVFIALFAVIFWLVRKLVVNNIIRVNRSLSKITGGNLDEVVNVRSNEEFAALSDDINSTVDTLKQYIADEAARIDAELAFAKNIQQSVLPSVFPPYPDREDFSLYATMDTAREVGGDFYDFYLLEEKRLAFLIADVSGKGIPAAMFMMQSKTVLRDYAERGNEPVKVFVNTNNKLYEGNDAEMFVTCWMGFLKTDTGLVSFVNAGHNPPVIVRNGLASFIKQKSNMVLAGMSDMPYMEQQVQLEKGDFLFLYTDGVVEATDAHDQLYGEERLLKILSKNHTPGEEGCREICADVKQDVDLFVGEAPQFDDMTMLCLYYAG